VIKQLHADVEMTCSEGQSKVHGLFVFVFYLNVSRFLIIAKVIIQTCVFLNGFKNENILHQVAMLTQLSKFGACRFGNPVTKMVGCYVS
jgi:hypothetical protein